MQSTDIGAENPLDNVLKYRITNSFKLMKYSPKQHRDDSTP